MGRCHASFYTFLMEDRKHSREPILGIWTPIRNWPQPGTISLTVQRLNTEEGKRRSEMYIYPVATVFVVKRKRNVPCQRNRSRWAWKSRISVRVSILYVQPDVNFNEVSA